MASDLAAAVAAYGLVGAPPLPEEPISADAFFALLGDCQRHRILGILGTAVRDGAFPVTDGQRDDVERHWVGWLAHSVRLERLLLDVDDVLAEAGIRSIVLKGMALAHLDYPEPAMRVFGDLDLLIEPHAFTRAASVLEAGLGATRVLPELRPGFDDRFGKEIMVRSDRFEVDLHRMFVEGPYGLTMHLADLWQDPEPFSVGGRELLALGRVPRALHAAYAAALGDWPPRLAPARDLAQIMQRGVTAAEMIDAARSWRADAVVAAGLALTSALLGLGAPEAIARTEDRPAHVRDRVFLASYRGGARGYARQVAGAVVIRGLGARLRYLGGILFPTRAYLDARGLGRLDFGRGVWRRLRSGRGSTEGR